MDRLVQAAAEAGWQDAQRQRACFAQGAYRGAAQRYCWRTKHKVFGAWRAAFKVLVGADQPTCSNSKLSAAFVWPKHCFGC